MQYACIRQTFLGGRPVEVGTVIESASDPGDCFVLASSFSDEGATTVERIERAVAIGLILADPSPTAH